MNVRFTLVADGPSDAALLPILIKLIGADPRVTEIDPQFAHPTALPPASDGLGARVAAALSLHPANLLFVHRDAERESSDARRQEIEDGLRGLPQATFFVPVVPVRMTEAWLLFNEAAIRRAAGNPNGEMLLDLPRLQDVESTPNPKGSLHNALTAACGLRGRALRKFRVREAASRVVDLIDDFSPLAVLPAYGRLRRDLRQALDGLGGT